ncbi:DUF4112 domain-containing protein [Glaciecola sp.]|jgi:hypothetical protein|uniref:DUF4112 domain-containing protein n=1 Tax=Glaciecola sp. MF2-115 TaxID=3384827 RepID=UPI003989CCD0|mmetsp:Transcript_72279/g.227878  ORF Transcript_72279/g.227878 Transcript_72279/m.227878 type:complete len:158 (+) Transcript_72279:451-924(+)
MPQDKKNRDLQIKEAIASELAPEHFRAPDALLQAQSIANLLDTAVKVPFVGIKVGLDFLVGLVPVVGDATMLLASFRIVHLGRKLGIPKALQTAMLRNAIIDFGLGFIPVVGDVVDLFYKANQKNVRIMERWWIEQNKAKVDALAKQKLHEWEQQQD